MAQFRIFVTDVGQSADFYARHFGFAVKQKFGPNMAILTLDDLTLWLAGPGASASRPMPDGAQPGPGGWNRIALTVDDLPAMVTRLKTAGVSFRNDIVSGPGGLQILVTDPSGNVMELFQPA
jgi:predicted enzyme related to lactoylglutathione lyase